jgi:hypothetical protein
MLRSNGGREEKLKVHYLPLPLPFFALLVGAFLVLVALIQIGILRYAYLRVGVSSRYRRRIAAVVLELRTQLFLLLDDAGR